MMQRWNDGMRALNGDAVRYYEALCTRFRIQARTGLLVFDGRVAMKFDKVAPTCADVFFL